MLRLTIFVAIKTTINFSREPLFCCFVKHVYCIAFGECRSPSPSDSFLFCLASLRALLLFFLVVHFFDVRSQLRWLVINIPSDKDHLETLVLVCHRHDEQRPLLFFPPKKCEVFALEISRLAVGN